MAKMLTLKLGPRQAQLCYDALIDASDRRSRLPPHAPLFTPRERRSLEKTAKDLLRQIAAADQ